MDFVFRLVAPSDTALLEEWLLRPHVAEWGWHGPIDPPSDIYQPFIVELDGKAIGFIQAYVVAAHPDFWPDEKDPGARGIDQFLADGEMLGRGIGSAMVRAFVDRLFEDAAVTKVQTDPAPDNGSAIRAFEKAGFRKAGVVTTPDGPVMLMIIER